MSRGALVLGTRSDWAIHKQDLFLLVLPILHSVCARRLNGENAYLALRPAVCQCIRAECSLGQGVKTTGSERSLERQIGLPERLRNVSRSAGPSGGCSLHSPGSAAHYSSSAERLSRPGMWMAQSNPQMLLTQRRRWQASCEGSADHLVGWCTVAVLSMQTSMCLPCKHPQRLFKARAHC